MRPDTVSQEAASQRSMSVPEQLPEWEALLRAAARLQGVLPDATLVGGTAAALHAGHRWPRWVTWQAVEQQCAALAVAMAEAIATRRAGWTDLAIDR